MRDLLKLGSTICGHVFVSVSPCSAAPQEAARSLHWYIVSKNCMNESGA